MTTSTNVKEKLLSAEYEHPFKWDLTKLNKKKYFPGLLERLSSYSVEDDSQFEYMMLHVLLSYLYGNGNKILRALNLLESGESKLNEFTNNSPDITTYGQAFLHIVRSMKAYLLLMRKNISAVKLEETLTTIPKVDEMNKENLASLYGLRASFYGEFGFEGYRLALNFLAKAIEMNAEEAAWHYLKGKYIGMVRHIEHPQSPPGVAETRHLELAVSMKENNGSYTLLVANLYREEVKNSKSRLHYNELNKKAYDLYKKSAELKPECSQNLFRCAKGIMRLPPSCRDMKLVKQLLEKGLTLDPLSDFGHHSMAQYYENVGEKNWRNEAIKHLKFCEREGRRNFPAVMDLIRLEYSVDGQTANVVEKLERLLDVYKHKSQRCAIFARLSSYHLFSLVDLFKACQYASYIGLLEGNYECVKRHKPLCKQSNFKTSETIDLRATLMDKIRKAVQNLKHPVDEETSYLEAFLTHLSSPSKMSVPKPPGNSRIQLLTNDLKFT